MITAEETMSEFIRVVEGEIGEERWDEISSAPWNIVRSNLMSLARMRDVISTIEQDGIEGLTRKMQDQMGWAMRHMAILYTLNRYGMFVNGSPGNWGIEFRPGSQQDWRTFIENLNLFTDDVVVLEDMPDFPPPYRRNAAKFVLQRLVESRIAMIRMGMAGDKSEAGGRLDEVIDLMYDVLKRTPE